MRSFLAMMLMCGVFVASTAAADAALYGAIATTSTYPVAQYGYGINARTVGAAEAIALAGCRTHSRYACFVRIWFTGPGVCGAVAQHGSRQGWGYARTVAGARLLALRTISPPRSIAAMLQRSCSHASSTSLAYPCPMSSCPLECRRISLLGSDEHALSSNRD